MTKQTVSQELLIRRLKRIEGQVRGIQKMIGDGRDCESIITQLAAVRSAIEGVGTLVIRNCMKLNLGRGTGQEPADIDALTRAVCVWGRVRSGGHDVPSDDTL
jgi:DNA-binding FrmR family transcriptional regulator